MDLIGEYVELRPAGANHKGRCPFHHEKSPSFMVHRERQFFHCFGCGKGGDAFTFMQEMEGMDFVEALRFLAGRAGIPLETLEDGAGASARTRIKEINAEAARFFHLFLLQMSGAAAAREYLARRGLSAETIEEWRIGFVPDQWDLLTKYLLKKGFGIDDLTASGLTIRRDGADARTGRGYYDRFRGRVMFPLSDVHGNVVGFTGRVLVETPESGGKYVNTPQTPVYDKSRVVFGLDKAKQAIKSARQIVMVEGQMDVIACHQAGMKNVVATSGTAMTVEQVQLLKRYADAVKIAFDADAAGLAAADRGIGVAIREGMSVKVIRIPEGAGKDPDECIKKNPLAWQKAVDDARPILAWWFDRAFLGKTASDPREKQAIADELLPKVAAIPFAVERDYWLRFLAEKLDVGVEVLKEDLERLKQLKSSELKVQSSQKDDTPHTSEKKTRLDMLSERLLCILIRFPNLAGQVLSQVPDSALSTSPYGALYESIKNIYTKQSVISSAALRASLDSDAMCRMFDILQLEGEKDFSEFTETVAEAEQKKIVAYIRDEWQKSERARIQHAIALAERGGDRVSANRLLKELQEMSR